MIEYVPVEECKSEGNFVKAVCFKPKKSVIVVAVLGVLLLIPNSMICRVLGAFFIAMAFAVYKLVRDFKVMDIFDKGIMFYGDEEAKSACFIPFDEMESWDVEHENGHDTVGVALKDGRVIVKDTFEADKAYKALTELVREKDLKYIKAKKDAERALSIPDAMKNIKKTFRRK